MNKVSLVSLSLPGILALNLASASFSQATQINVVSYNVQNLFDTFDELYNKVFRSAKYKLEQENKPKDEVPDSNYTPEFINFTEPKKNLPEKPKSEKEKIEPPLENVPEE